MTKLYKKMIPLFAFLALMIQVGAQTTVPSIISSNQVWTAANSPYLVYQNTLVKPGVQVKVEPGTVIKSNGKVRIIVDGEFIADGTFDSVIVMDSVNFEFNKVSGGYNFKTNTGSYFDYCHIKGGGTSSIYIIKLNSVSMSISNCKFTNTYYSIYGTNGSYDTTMVRIVRTIFEGDGSGYAANITGNCAHLEMDECYVKNMCGLYPPANFKMTRSTIIGQSCYSAIRIMRGGPYYRGHAYIRCNTFKNFKGGVFESFYLDSFNTIDLTNNTFDTADYFLSLYAGNIGNTAKLNMNKNNFMYSRQSDVKFSASSSAGIYKTYDLQDNYWGTTDTNDIKASIHDYLDDITIMALVDYSNFRTSYNTICSEEFTSIKNNRLAQLKVYPNPANGSLNIDFENETERTIRLYDGMGRLVIEIKSLDETVALDVSGLGNGAYAMMVLEDGKYVYSGKVMIAH